MNTVEALSTMDNQGVSQIWFDDNSIAIDGENFELFYCTLDGKRKTLKFCRQTLTHLAAKKWSLPSGVKFQNFFHGVRQCFKNFELFWLVRFENSYFGYQNVVVIISQMKLLDHDRI